jgi:hypothetical protein
MIKFLDILKESDDNIFIPRRTKEEKDKKLLFRAYRKIRDYIKNGSQGNLDLRQSSIEFLPKNLTQVNGDLMLIECVNLKSLPNNLTVNGRLDLEGCKNITSLPSGLKVKGFLDLRDTNITELPPDLEVEASIYLQRTPIEKLPNNFTVNGDLDLDDCKNITSLPSGLKVTFDLDLRGTNITKLPPDLEVENDLILIRTPLPINYSRDEIRKMVLNVKGKIYP